MATSYYAINHKTKEKFGSAGWGNRLFSIACQDSPFPGMFVMRHLGDSDWQIKNDSEDNNDEEYTDITNEVYSAYKEVYGFCDKTGQSSEYQLQLKEIKITDNNVTVFLTGRDEYRIDCLCSMDILHPKTVRAFVIDEDNLLLDEKSHV